MTAPALNPQTMKRLAFIRLLYGQGVEQSHLPEPLTFTSVLTFHDAVELFLVLAAEHLGASLPEHTQFMAYWPGLHPDKLRGGVDLSGKTGMSRLNRLRNAFKHAGSLPGAPAVEQSRADVTAFFEDSTPKVFGLSFEAIDMADVIPQEEAKTRVKAAAVENAAGNRIKAMGLLVVAFDELFHSQSAPYRHARSPFMFGRDISRPLNEGEIRTMLGQPEHFVGWPTATTADLARQIDETTRAVTAMQRGLRVIALGIDYWRYHRFIQQTPRVDRDPDGEFRYRHAPDYAPSESDFDYCQQFVVTVALRLAEIQAHTSPA